MSEDTSTPSPAASIGGGFQAQPYRSGRGFSPLYRELSQTTPPWVMMHNPTGEILRGVSSNYDWRTFKPTSTFISNQTFKSRRDSRKQRGSQGRPDVPNDPSPVMGPDQPGPTSNQSYGGVANNSNSDYYLGDVHPAYAPESLGSGTLALGSGTQAALGPGSQTALGAGPRGLNGRPKGSQFNQQLALGAGPPTVRPVFADTSSSPPYTAPNNMGAKGSYAKENPSSGGGNARDPNWTG